MCKPKSPDCEVLRLLTRSGFVSVHSLGKLLLCTSKKMTNSIYTNDEVWKLLIQSRFSFDSFNSPTSILPLSLKQVFHFLQKREARRPATPIHTLEFVPRDYTLIVSLYYMDWNDKKQAIFTKFIDGDTIPSFFIDGSFEFDLSDDTPYYDFILSIHIMRADGKCCCLLGSEIGQEMRENQIWFYQNRLEMNELNYANTLWKNLPSSSHYSSIEVMEDVGLQVDLDYVIPSFPEVENSVFYLEMVSFRKISVEAVFSLPHEFVAFRKMNSWKDEPSKASNITFAHFLEELYGWYH